MEAIVLAGGRAERLGDAAQGKPKPLVPVAGRPLLAYTVERLHKAGVDRLIVACSAGRGEEFVRDNPVLVAITSGWDDSTSSSAYAWSSGATSVWQSAGTKGAGVSVAVLDTGVSAVNDLTGRISRGWTASLE